MAFADEVQTVLDDCHDALGAVAVTVTRRVEGAFQSSIGRREVTETEVSATAIRSEREMGSGAGGTMIVEVTYRVKATAMTGGFVPKPGDTVTDGTARRRVTRVSRAALDLAYDLVCRDERKS